MAASVLRTFYCLLIFLFLRAGKDEGGLLDHGQRTYDAKFRVAFEVLFPLQQLLHPP